MELSHIGNKNRIAGTPPGGCAMICRNKGGVKSFNPCTCGGLTKKFHNADGEEITPPYWEKCNDNSLEAMFRTPTDNLKKYQEFVGDVDFDMADGYNVKVVGGSKPTESAFALGTSMWSGADGYTYMAIPKSSDLYGQLEENGWSNAGGFIDVTKQCGLKPLGIGKKGKAKLAIWEQCASQVRMEAVGGSSPKVDAILSQENQYTISKEQAVAEKQAAIQAALDAVKNESAQQQADANLRKNVPSSGTTNTAQKSNMTKWIVIGGIVVAVGSVAYILIKAKSKK